MEKNTILSLKITICLKSIKLKTEYIFHTIFIWLITSNHVNLLLWCHWRVVLFWFHLCLFFISFSSFFPPLSSYSILTTFPISYPPWHFEKEIYHYNVPKKHFHCLKLTPHINLNVRTELVLLRDTSSAAWPTKTKKKKQKQNKNQNKNLLVQDWEEKNW